MQEIALRVSGERFVAMGCGPECGPERGRVALFLHGFPDVPTTWRPVMRAFADRGYRCVAPFLRGYAPSTAAGPFHLEQIADDVRGFMDELSPGRPVHVLGHDWGAAATWIAMLSAPARFAAAVAVAVPHPAALLRHLPRHPAQLWRSRYMAALQLRSIDARGIKRLWRRWSPRYPLGDDHLTDIVNAIGGGGDGAVQYYRAMRTQRPKLTAALTRQAGVVRVPTLYLHGADDGCIGAALARGQARWVDAAFEVEVVTNAGHFLPLERPVVVAERALAFFERAARS